MRRFFYILLILAFHSRASAQEFIPNMVGGTPPTGKTYGPHLGLVTIELINNSRTVPPFLRLYMNRYCSSIPLTPSVVITAAHCYTSPNVGMPIPKVGGEPDELELGFNLISRMVRELERQNKSDNPNYNNLNQQIELFNKSSNRIYAASKTRGANEANFINIYGSTDLVRRLLKAAFIWRAKVMPSTGPQDIYDIGLMQFSPGDVSFPPTEITRDGQFSTPMEAIIRGGSNNPKIAVSRLFYPATTFNLPTGLWNYGGYLEGKYTRTRVSGNVKKSEKESLLNQATAAGGDSGAGVSANFTLDEATKRVRGELFGGAAVVDNLNEPFCNISALNPDPWEQPYPADPAVPHPLIDYLLRNKCEHIVKWVDLCDEAPRKFVSDTAARWEPDFKPLIKCGGRVSIGGRGYDMNTPYGNTRLTNPVYMDEITWLRHEPEMAVLNIDYSSIENTAPSKNVSQHRECSSKMYSSVCNVDPVNPYEEIVISENKIPILGFKRCVDALLEVKHYLYPGIWSQVDFNGADPANPHIKGECPCTGRPTGEPCRIPKEYVSETRKIHSADCDATYQYWEETIDVSDRLAKFGNDEQTTCLHVFREMAGMAIPYAGPMLPPNPAAAE